MIIDTTRTYKRGNYRYTVIEVFIPDLGTVGHEQGQFVATVARTDDREPEGYPPVELEYEREDWEELVAAQEAQ